MSLTGENEQGLRKIVDQGLPAFLYWYCIFIFTAMVPLSIGFYEHYLRQDIDKHNAYRAVQ